jgi:hypothetical protein
LPKKAESWRREAVWAALRLSAIGVTFCDLYFFMTPRECDALLGDLYAFPPKRDLVAHPVYVVEPPEDPTPTTPMPADFSL